VIRRTGETAMIRILKCYFLIPFLPLIYSFVLSMYIFDKLMTMSDRFLYPEDYEKEVYTYEFKLNKDISKKDRNNLDKLLCYYFRIEDNELRAKLIDGASFMCNFERDIK